MQGAAVPVALVLLLAHARFCMTCSVFKGFLICGSIPSEFDPTYQLVALVLQNVGRINSTVFDKNGFGSVTTLHLNGSGVTEISENAFRSGLQLRSLSLDRNLLSEMNTNWFRDPASLDALSLAGNRIEVVNATALRGLTNLKQLWLNNNRIRTIHPDSFTSLVSLTELDLSGNQLTRLSPRLLGSLRSVRSICLHGNRWSCACDAAEFVASLKDLQNRSVLVRPAQVTCENPPSLKGQPVLNVTICPTATAILTSTESSRTRPNPLITVPASSADGTSGPQMRRTSTMDSGIHVSSFHSKPAFTPFTVLNPSGATGSASSSSPPPDPKIFGTLVSIMVLLCLLLGVVCLLLAMHRQKRSSKTVTPGCPGEGEQERQRQPDVSGSILHLSSYCDELRGPEEASRRGFRGDRAKSAHAVILTAPFGVSGRDEVTLQSEQSCGVSEDPQDTGAGQRHLTGLTVMKAQQEHEGGEERGDQEENPQSGISVNIDVVPYLSIGRGQNKPGPDEESTEGRGQSPQSRKMRSRISSWPPTAAQWRARCKVKEEEEDVWTGGAAEETVNQKQPSAGSDRHSEDEENNPPRSSTHQEELQEEEKQEGEKLQDEEDAHEVKEDLQEEEELQEAEELSENGAGGSGDGIRQKRRQTSPENAPHKTGKSSKPEAALGKQSAGSKAAGSNAPSGGATPDDETLLSGNEYVFVNLLHEVAHNNGRWTRERWKQTHLNKQRL